jgi:hypothetical protein
MRDRKDRWFRENLKNRLPRSPDTFDVMTSRRLSWELVREESQGVGMPLVEESPYVDRIEFLPDLAICSEIPRQDQVEGPPTFRPMGWAEYQRRQREGRDRILRWKRVLTAVRKALASEGYSLKEPFPSCKRDSPTRY